MTACEHCGKEFAGRKPLCDACNSYVDHESTTDQNRVRYFPSKDKKGAKIVSVVMCGWGQIYAGRIVRGLAIFIPYFFIMVFTWVLIFLLFTKGLSDSEASALIVMFTLMIAIMAWSARDTARLIDEYNEIVKQEDEISSVDSISVVVGKTEYIFSSYGMVILRNGKVFKEVPHKDIKSITYNPEYGWKDVSHIIIGALVRVPDWIHTRDCLSIFHVYNTWPDTIFFPVPNYIFEKIRPFFTTPVELV